MKQLLSLLFIAFLALSLNAQLIMTADGAANDATTFSEHGTDWTIETNPAPNVGSVQDGLTWVGSKYIIYQALPANSLGVLSWNGGKRALSIKVANSGNAEITVKAYATTADIPASPKGTTTITPADWGTSLSTLTFDNSQPDWTNIQALTFECASQVDLILDDLSYYAVPYEARFLSSGNWESIDWLVRVVESPPSDYTVNGYPKLDGTNLMSNGDPINEITYGGSGSPEVELTIDASVLTEAQNGSLTVLYRPNGIVLKNFGGTSFRFGTVYTASGNFTNTEDPATPLTIGAFVMGAGSYSFQSAADVVFQSSVTFQSGGTHTFDENVTATGANPFGIASGTTVTIGGNANLYRPDIKHNATLSVGGNFTLDGNFPYMNMGNDNNPQLGEATVAVTGNFLIADARNSYSVHVYRRGNFTVGGTMDMKGLNIDEGGNVSVTGDINLKYASGFITLNYGPDHNYGGANLTVGGNISVTNTTGNNITVNQAGTVTTTSILTPNEITINQGGTLNITGDFTVPTGKNLNVNGAMNIGQTP